MSKMPPSERTREALNSLLTEGLVGQGDPRSEMVRLSVQHLVEQALEAVVRDVAAGPWSIRKCRR
jgi:hypothetical protein